MDHESREMGAQEDDTVEVPTWEVEILDGRTDRTGDSPSYIDIESDRGAETLLQPTRTSALPEPARRAAHRLQNFAMAGEKQELVLAQRLRIDENPVSTYLASLAESSRRPMRTNLETIAYFVSGGQAGAMDLAWWRLRYQHMTLIRSTLAETYAPATANLMLAAVRGVLKACFRLGYISADDLQRAVDVPPFAEPASPLGAPLSAASSTISFGYATWTAKRLGVLGTLRSSLCCMCVG